MLQEHVPMCELTLRDTTPRANGLNIHWILLKSNVETVCHPLLIETVLKPASHAVVFRGLVLLPPHKVQQVELHATCRGDKINIVARFVLHKNKSMNSHEGTCHCSMSPQHFLVCEVAVILSQLHVPATYTSLLNTP